MPALVHKKQILGQATDTEALVRDTVGWTCKNRLQNVATTQTVNGVTFTVNEDLSVSTSGTASANTEFVLATPILDNGETYILSGCPEGGSLSTYAIRRRLAGSGLESGDIGEGYKFIQSSTYYTYSIYIASGVSTNGLVFKPMIRRSSIMDGTYEAYETTVEERLELIEQASTGITLSATMSVANWEENVYSFESTYPASQYDVSIEPNGDIITASQYSEWGKAGIVGRITENSCIAMGTVPKEDIPIILKVVERSE